MAKGNGKQPIKNLPFTDMTARAGRNPHAPDYALDVDLLTEEPAPQLMPMFDFPFGSFLLLWCGY